MNSQALTNSFFLKAIRTPGLCSFRDYAILWEFFDPGDIQTRRELIERFPEHDEGELNEIYGRYFHAVTKNRKFITEFGFKGFCKRCLDRRAFVPETLLWACHDIANDKDFMRCKSFDRVIYYLCKSGAHDAMIDAAEQLWIRFAHESRRHST